MDNKINIHHFVSSINYAYFDSYRNGVFYYTINHVLNLKKYQFQIPIEDITGATLLSKDKSIFFMRWIRKCIEQGTFIELK